MTERIVTDANGRKHITTEPMLHAAELADVTAGIDHAVEQAAKNADEVLRLRAEVAGMREDAERWRHVRDKSAWTATSANGMTRIAIRLMVDTPIEADDELDAAVDEARKAAP